MFKDIVCGRGVEEDDPRTFTLTYNGERFFFCSEDCLLLFCRCPQDYLVKPTITESTAWDPVCGMDVDMNNPPSTSKHLWQTYYFCCHSCQLEFEYDPAVFIKKVHQEGGERHA